MPARVPALLYNDIMQSLSMCCICFVSQKGHELKKAPFIALGLIYEGACPKWSLQTIWVLELE